MAYFEYKKILLKMIIVSGIHRTGTSLMMDILEKNGFYAIKTNMKFEEDEFFKNLQPEYHEHKAISKGLTKETGKGLENIFSRKDSCLKLLGSVIDLSDTSQVKHFDKIIIMVRNWRSQTKSWENIQRRNLYNVIVNDKKLLEKLHTKELKEKYINLMLTPDGISYFIDYYKILLFVNNNKLWNKVTIVKFEDMVNNFKFISRKLHKIVNKKLKNNDVIKIDNSKFKDVSEVNLEEVEDGLFEFLDRFQDRLLNRNFDLKFWSECEKWRSFYKSYTRDLRKVVVEGLS